MWAGTGASAARSPRGAHARRRARRTLPFAGANRRRGALGAGSARAARSRARRLRTSVMRASPTSGPISCRTSSSGSCRTSRAAAAMPGELSFVPRMREWRDVHEQLKQALDWPECLVRPEKEEGYRAIHRALLAGLLGNVGCATRRSVYRARAASSSGSIPARGRKTRQVDRRRRACRDYAAFRAHRRGDRAALARGDRRAPHQRFRADPHWEKNRGEVMALERGTLYGCRYTSTGACLSRRTTRISRATSSYARRWSRETSRRERLSSHTIGASSPISSASSTNRAAGHPGRRRADPRLLRRAHPREVNSSQSRKLAPARRSGTAAPALPRARRPDAARGGRHHDAELPAGARARTEPLYA